MATPAQHRKHRHAAVWVVVVLVVVIYAVMRTQATAPAVSPGTLDMGGNLPTGPSGAMATGLPAFLTGGSYPTSSGTAYASGGGVTSGVTTSSAVPTNPSTPLSSYPAGAFGITSYPPGATVGGALIGGGIGPLPR